MIEVETACTKYHMNVSGTVLEKYHTDTKCITRYVSEKSRHDLDFPTKFLIRQALMTEFAK